MRRRVVVTDFTFPDLNREEQAAQASQADFVSFQCRSETEVERAVKGADVAIVQFAPLTERAINGLANGAAIIRYGTGFDNIDLEAANRSEHPVGYVPDYCPGEVADHTATSLLSLLRKLPRLDASVRAGEWAAVSVARPLIPFNACTVGFFGFGRIARAVYRRLAPFGFSFLATDPNCDTAGADYSSVVLVGADELFSRSDAVCLHAPANQETIGFVNGRRLKTMKSNAVIVNTARGSLVKEADLAEALKHGIIAGAALDVFQTEPLPMDSPLRDAPNLLMSPHAAWYSEAAIGRLQALVAEDIASHLAGRPLRMPVPGSIMNGTPVG